MYRRNHSIIIFAKFKTILKFFNLIILLQIVYYSNVILFSIHNTPSVISFINLNYWKFDNTLIWRINYYCYRDLIIKNNPLYYVYIKSQNQSIFIALVFRGHIDLIAKMDSTYIKYSDPLIFEVKCNAKN